MAQGLGGVERAGLGPGRRVNGGGVGREAATAGFRPLLYASAATQMYFRSRWTLVSVFFLICTGNAGGTRKLSEVGSLADWEKWVKFCYVRRLSTKNQVG